MDPTSLTQNVDSFIKSNGITGNTLLDGLLIAHLVPFLLSYINSLVSFFTQLIKDIFNFVFSYVKFITKIKMVGNTLCIIIIKKNNELYDGLVKILNSNSKMEELDTKFAKLMSMSDFGNAQEEGSGPTYW